MDRKAIVHMEGGTLDGKKYEMAIMTTGKLSDQLTMVARYIIQAASDNNLPTADLLWRLIQEVQEQKKSPSISIDRKAIQDAIDQSNGQKN